MFKRQSSCNHRIQCYSQSPNVSLGCIIFFTSQHLGCSIARRTTTGPQQLTLSKLLAQTKVNDFEVVSRYKNIFGFDISMANFIAMEISYRIKQLGEIVQASFFRKIFLLNYSVVQFFPFYIFCHNVYVLKGFMKLQKSNNVRMVQFFEDRQLSMNSVQILLFRDLLLLQHLYGNLLSSWQVHSFVDLPKCSFPYCLPYLEIAYPFLQTQTHLYYFQTLIIMTKTIIILISLLTIISSKRLLIQLNENQQFCFYDVFQINQKYSFSAILQSEYRQKNFEISVKNIQTGKWVTVYSKQSESKRRLQVNKIASETTTYSFCAKNYENQKLQLVVRYVTGLQMLQFSLLPDKTDSENVDRQINWISQQQTELQKKLMNKREINMKNREITKIMGTKFIVIAIICLLFIIGINYGLYRKIKGTFKERKLI